MIEEAVLEWRKNGPTAELQEWFWPTTDAEAHHPFAFLNVCDAVGVDPDWIRKHLDQPNGNTYQIGAASRVERHKPVNGRL